MRNSENHIPSTLDSKGMFEIEERFPENLEEALERYANFSLPPKVEINSKTTIRYATPSNAVIAGMGGSAIGGDFIKRWFRKTLGIPLEVCRSYELPGYVDENSLVVTISYSGETEETLSCFVEAIHRRSMIVGIASAGRLAGYCSRLGIPLIRVPTGYPPRAALPFILGALITVMSRFEFLKCRKRDLKEALQVLKKVRDETKRLIPVEKNIAKSIASKLTGSIIVIYAEEAFEEAARRWKDQLNENGKMLARIEVFPELNHNDLVGWENSRVSSRRYSVMILRDTTEEPAMRARVDITTDILRKKGLNVIELYPEGKSLLSKTLYFSYVGDMVSLYSAVRARVNPFETEFITQVKKGLADRVNHQSLLDRAISQMKEKK
ncbi:MAG TPA: bifunctional phosphoglucose/phosphomannose isomerase [Candidatus Bathyarchaeia archaeon]|nr:bifunctional phosphoglucose/phosphomannose isomerase [Candidatus Bathyarchaeia archaeon]